jgi:hypothetical protein
MEKASNATSGAMFGSVPMPVNMPPTAMPVTQNTACRATPAARKGRGRRLTHGPAAIVNDSAARSHGSGELPWGRALATEFSKWAYHEGWPLAALETVEAIAPLPRLAGNSHKTEDSSQNPDQTKSGAPLPSGPAAAADDAIPGCTSSLEESVGQTSSPMAG